MRKHQGHIVGVVVLGLTVAACDVATGPDRSEQALNASVAMVAADETLSDLGIMHDPSHGGLPFAGERTVIYFDAAGNEQSEFEDLTTATIRITSNLSGELSRQSWTAAVVRTNELTITGLEGEETSRTVNGSATQDVTRSRHADEFGSRTHNMTSSSSIENVVIGVPREENPYPLSGTIRRSMTMNVVNGPDGAGSRSKDVVINFDGTQFPAMTVDGEPFEIDLDARGDQKPFGSRRGR